MRVSLLCSLNCDLRSNNADQFDLIKFFMIVVLGIVSVGIFVKETHQAVVCVVQTNGINECLEFLVKKFLKTPKFISMFEISYLFFHVLKNLFTKMFLPILIIY